MIGSTNDLTIAIKTIADTLGINQTKAAIGEMDAMQKTNLETSSNWSKGLAVAGVAVGVGIAAGAVVAIKSAGDFQASITKLTTSAGESVQNLGMVSDGVLKIARDTGTTTQQLADAMYKVESGGQHGADGLIVLKAAAQGAKAEQSDLTTVADALTSVLVDYHLKASESADVTSKLVAATAAGKMSFEDLAGAMPAILPVASAAHVSLNDILGDMASMTVHGMSAQQSAENLTDTIRHMQAPTAAQGKELALLGMTTTQLADDLKNKGLSGTLQEISTKIQNLMPPGSDKVILNLKTALSGLSDPVKELGQHLFDGTMTMKEYSKAASALDPIAAKQAMSFATLAGATHRIGNEQMTGADVMQNYTQSLAAATGDATGLKVALMLTGENAQTTNDAIKSVSGSTADAAGNVKGWSEVQSTFNNKLQKFDENIQTATISLGMKLLPAAGAALDSISAMGDGIDKSIKFLQQHSKEVTIAASVLTVLFGPALVGVAAQAVITGVKTVGAAIASGAAWVYQAAVMSVKWEIEMVKMVGKGIAVAASSVVQAAIASGSWIASATLSSAAWLRELPKVVLQGTITATKAAISAADTSLAWVLNATRVSFVWATQEMPKLVASFVVTSTKATVQAAITSAVWVTNAVRTSTAWVVTELPKIVGGFIVTSASAVAQALVSSGAWVLSATTSGTAWVVTQLPRIIGAFVAMAGSAIAQAAIASSAWVAAAVTSSASYSAFAALVATPLVMPAIAVAAAIAAIWSVWTAYQGMKSAIEEQRSTLQMELGEDKKMLNNAYSVVNSGVASPARKAAAQRVIDNISNQSHRAAGGSVNSGTPYWVGDNADGSLNATSELFVPSQSGAILTKDDAKKAISGGQGGGTTNHFHGNIILGDSSAVTTFFDKLDQDGLLVGKGLTPSRGIN